MLRLRLVFRTGRRRQSSRRSSCPHIPLGRGFPPFPSPHPTPSAHAIFLKFGANVQHNAPNVTVDFLEVKVKVEGQNRRTEIPPLAIALLWLSGYRYFIFTKFGNPTELFSTQNMPLGKVQDGGGQTGALSSYSFISMYVFTVVCCVCFLSVVCPLFSFIHMGHVV